MSSGNVDSDEFKRWKDAYPRERPPPPEGVFELGLCMAGAISGGAYTAGVLDFLIEALDAFAAERKKLGDNRLHQVRLPVMGGASAGGMCSAIATAFLDRSFPPVRANTPLAEKSCNPLYRAWVEEIDITRLLGLNDGVGSGKLVSLLDSTVLDDIVGTVLGLRDGMPKARRPWLVAPFRSLLTLGNLRGVPYGLRFNNTTIEHWMVQHADHARLLLCPDKCVGAAQGDAAGPDEHMIDLTSANGKAAFAALALGTGAFPAALQPRIIRPPVTDYTFRAMLTPASEIYPKTPVSPLPACAAVLRPAWPAGVPPYQALCVDGGTMNNEPLDLVHRALAGFGAANPRELTKANRAMVMVDPFVLRDPTAGVTQQGVLGPLFDLFGALVQNSRFKPEELALAADSSIASRALISPSRGDDAAGERAMAAGYLGGFMGFMSRAYREHDFALGRRNCQGFLLSHFRLPETNVTLFGPPGGNDRWTEADRERFGRSVGGQRYLPLIPLCGSVAEEEPLPTWPAGVFQAETIRAAIDARARAVVPALIDEMAARLGLGGFKTWLLRQARWTIQTPLVNLVVRRIADEISRLDDAQLGTPPAPVERPEP
jgi:hypothetical protein